MGMNTYPGLQSLCVATACCLLFTISIIYVKFRINTPFLNGGGLSNAAGSRKRRYSTDMSALRQGVKQYLVPSARKYIRQAVHIFLPGVQESPWHLS